MNRLDWLNETQKMEKYTKKGLVTPFKMKLNDKLKIRPYFIRAGQKILLL